MMNHRTPTPPSPLRDRPLLRDGFLWLALALTIFAVAPFLKPGYFWGANDARHHVYFLFEFDRLWQDGVWWPRWSPDFAFGYGYPFFNIYGPFSHFLAELLHYFAQFNFVQSVEIVFGLSIVASAGAMYGYVRALAGRSAGLLAAVVYTYAPYHLMVLYVRANLAESMAFVWLPLCLWSFRACVHRPARWTVIAAALAYAGLILTSNLVWVLFTPVLMLYILVLLFWQERDAPRLSIARLLRRALAPLAGAGTGLGLSAIFWLPMLLERGYVRVDQWFDGRYNFRDDFVYFFQFFSPRWDFGVSLPGPNDTLGFQIGPVLLLFALLGALFAWRRHSLRAEIVVFAVTGLGAAALGWTLLAPLWDWPLVGAVLQSAQFPWRWLPLTVVGFSVLAGLLFVAEWGTNGTDRVGGEAAALSLPLFAVVSVAILASYPLLQVQTVPPAEGPVGLAALMRFERDADEMTGSTAWVKEIPTWSPMAEYYINLDEAGQPVTPVTSKVDYEALDYSVLAVGSVAHNSVMEEIYFCTDPGDRPGQCNPRDDQRVVFNHFYYPGWRAWLLDGEHGQPVRELPVIPESEGVLGRMTVPIPPTGEGFILLRYGDTPPRTIGQWISLATLLLLLGGAVTTARRK
ncbi:MAG: 6-pyruvoyl-tetrahydropterin synthase-related protein [Caldilineaceae bacterium]